MLGMQVIVRNITRNSRAVVVVVVEVVVVVVVVVEVVGD